MKEIFRRPHIANPALDGRLRIAQDLATSIQNQVVNPAIHYPATLAVLVVTVTVSILAFRDQAMMERWMFKPREILAGKQFERLLTSGFLHADWMHLGFNMLSLYMFGKSVEDAYVNMFDEKGILFYILLYVGGLAMSSLYSYERNKGNMYYNALGASGAVSAVIYSYIMIAPMNTLKFMFIPIDIPAYIFGFVYLGIEYYLSKKGNTGIAHDAHFWGAIYGVVLTIMIKPHAVSSFIDKITGG